MNSTENVDELLDVLKVFSSGVATYSDIDRDKPRACRRYSITELATMCNVFRRNIYEIYERHPELTPLEVAPHNKRSYGTIQHLTELYALLNIHPGRGDTELGRAISVYTPKGGSYKTSTTFNLAIEFANRGLKTCVIDIDPQATATLMLGYTPNEEIQRADTIFNWLTGQHGARIDINQMRWTQERQDDVDRARAQVKEWENGPDDGSDAPEHVFKASETDLKGTGCIRPTRHPNIDLIPSCLGLDFAGMVLSFQIHGADTEDPLTKLDAFFRLRNIVGLLKQHYDIVLIDGQPSFGTMGVNLVYAADTLIVPVATEVADIHATQAFSQLLIDNIEMVEEFSGGTGVEHPSLRFLVTKLSDKQTIEEQRSLKLIKSFAGDRCLDKIHKRATGTTKAASLYRSPSEIYPAGNDLNKRVVEKAAEMYSEIAQEILEKEVYPHWAKFRNEQESA